MATVLLFARHNCLTRRMCMLIFRSSGGFANPSIWFQTCSSRPALASCCFAFPSTESTNRLFGLSSPSRRFTAFSSSSSSCSNACQALTSGRNTLAARERAWILSSSLQSFTATQRSPVLETGSFRFFLSSWFGTCRWAGRRRFPLL